MHDNKFSHIRLARQDAIEQISEATDLEIKGVAHVGANVGQELPSYIKVTKGPIIMIEPHKETFDTLSRACAPYGNVLPLQAICSDEANVEIMFNISSNMSLSSSMLELGRHAEIYPHVVYKEKFKMTTTTLDDIYSTLDDQFKSINYLNIDTQGADLKVLRGARETLDLIDFVQIEVSLEPLYEGGCTAEEVRAYLEGAGFKQALQQISPLGWGEALYTRA